ncbi:MAG: PilZ domain-containing protein [Deltaproteobacteria bacterium]|nr:PilZ domain-containing protein [Deltaproteobacteria bacterium]
MKGLEFSKGEDRLGVIEELKNETTLLKMHITGKDFDRLTIITDILPQNTPPLFKIDLPDGFSERVSDIETLKMEFEFTGKENIRYAFRTVGGEILKDGIWIRFPESIERLQRRKFFRIRPPSGTKIFFEIDGKNLEFTVEDISLGGSLGVVAFIGQRDRRSVHLNVGDILKDIRLVFPSGGERFEVDVIKAIVNRIEKGLLKSKPIYALHFVEIEKKAEKFLTELLYRFQREFLRERLPVNDIDLQP